MATGERCTVVKMNEKQSRRERILTEPILPLVIKMSIPTIIGMLVNMLYNLTDTFFIGRLHNKSMTAAAFGESMIG